MVAGSLLSLERHWEFQTFGSVLGGAKNLAESVLVLPAILESEMHRRRSFKLAKGEVYELDPVVNSLSLVKMEKGLGVKRGVCNACRPFMERKEISLLVKEQTLTLSIDPVICIEALERFLIDLVLMFEIVRKMNPVFDVSSLLRVYNSPLFLDCPFTPLG